MDGGYQRQTAITYIWQELVSGWPTYSTGQCHTLTVVWQTEPAPLHGRSNDLHERQIGVLRSREDAARAPALEILEVPLGLHVQLTVISGRITVESGLSSSVLLQPRGVDIGVLLGVLSLGLGT